MLLSGEGGLGQGVTGVREKPTNSVMRQLPTASNNTGMDKYTSVERRIVRVPLGLVTQMHHEENLNHKKSKSTDVGKREAHTRPNN